ncbi:MAG: hypothetical protein ABI051_01180 [Vicinamibacterales bacterium]
MTTEHRNVIERSAGLTPRATAWRGAVVTGALFCVLAAAAPAYAQLDPLIGIKRLPPTVVVVLDTSFQMLFDGAGNYYDVKTYNRTDDAAVSTMFGVTSTQYRRIYQGLQFETTISPTSKYFASNIVTVQSTAVGYSTFWAPTRFETAKAGISQAVLENQSLVRWGLLKLRQNNEAWRNTTSNGGCDAPVRITGGSFTVRDSNPCSAVGSATRYVLYAPSSSGANFGQTTAPGDSVVYAVGSASAATNIQTVLNQTMGTGAVIPAGQGSSTYVDRPLYFALTDARAQAVSAIAADASATRACRNAVVVLVTSGKDDGDSTYLSHGSITTLAGTFASVTAGSGTRRVPIVVIGVKPAAADEAQLQAIATASGGVYFKATTAAEVTRAVNYAVQMGFSGALDVDAQRMSEFSFVSPVIGSVNLSGALSATGATLSNTSVVSTKGATTGVALPQRSNFLLTSGFGLPGFDGRLRAFRTYKPVADSTKATGWKFAKDGTRLWPDLDARPALAGMARVPLDSNSRNIYTFIPNASGVGGSMVAFSVANSATLSPHLGGADPAVLIPYVRAQPLGAVINSTPAIMDPPSLDPPPDSDYGFADSTDSFAGTYKNRRSIIFFGANDGMIHAVDARTGYEVWAFIPYNLLPKLATLIDGQPVEQFDYFVDSSPKIAEVKLGGNWRTLLVIGQGYGGTFYQALDVTSAGMGLAPDADGLSAVSSMLAQFDAPGESITFSWAFPRYSSFDPNVFYAATGLGNTYPGGRLVMRGDLKSSASNVEKRVGFTFSDPAVGTLATDRSINGVITGSGYFPAIEASLPGRGASAPAAGRGFFVLDASTGLPLGNPSGGSCAGLGCYDAGDLAGGAKNALQADVTASSDTGATIVSKAYVGDLDGRYWKFSFMPTGAITATTLATTGQPIYSSSALLFVGTTEKYLFFSTGSDLLPNTAPGGGGGGTGTAFNLYGVKDGTTGAVVFKQALSPKVTSSGSDLITNGERPTSSPTVAGDIVFFTTTTDAGTPGCADATTKVYAFTYTGTAAYDSNANGKIDSTENPVVATAVGRATAPFIVDQHLVIGTSSSLGAGVTMLGDSEDFNNGVGRVGVRILSWREIR